MFICQPVSVAHRPGCFCLLFSPTMHQTHAYTHSYTHTHTHTYTLIHTHVYIFIYLVFICFRPFSTSRLLVDMQDKLIPQNQDINTLKTRRILSVMGNGERCGNSVTLNTEAAQLETHKSFTASENSPSAHRTDLQHRIQLGTLCSSSDLERAELQLHYFRSALFYQFG